MHTPHNDYHPSSSLHADMAMQATARERELNWLFPETCDPRDGFEIGHSYEIGLGDLSNGVRWCGAGVKEEVFAEKEELSIYRDCEKLPLPLLDKAVFEVVK
jgi:hypothetical protein